MTFISEYCRCVSPRNNHIRQAAVLESAHWSYAVCENPSVNPRPCVLWFLFAASAVMAWCENRWIVGEYPLNRPFWFSSSNQAKFFVVRVLLTYSTLAALCYFHGFLVGLSAFVVYYVFNRITFRTYFSREVKSETEKYMQLVRENYSGKVQLDETQLMQDAKLFATAKVNRNLDGRFVWE